MKTKRYLKKEPKILNKEQLSAVEQQNGTFIIVAGPGTGKTLTLTQRIFYLIKEKKVKKENILALTFTNKAAQEMKERLEKLLGEKKINFVKTYHSLCYKILTKKEKFKEYSIIDENDREIVISDTLKTVGEKKLKKGAVLKQIIQAKRLLIGPKDNFDGLIEKKMQKKFSIIYKAYQEQLSFYHLFDFEDLLFRTNRLFSEDHRLKEYYQTRYTHLFIDEYQDLNYGQYILTKALAPPDTPNTNICVIGDPNQSIYGFRGADHTYFKKFVKDYPGAGVITLKQNYRSTNTILEASFSQIKKGETFINNEEKNKNNLMNSRVFSGKKGKEKIIIIESISEKAEAACIGKLIEESVGGVNLHSINPGKVDSSFKKKDRSFSDFTVLFRTGAQSRVFEQVFNKAGIPYQAVRKETVFESKGIPELISLLKIVEGTGSLLDIERTRGVTDPGVGKDTFNKFKNWFIKNRIELRTARYNVRRFPLPGLSRRRQTCLYNFLGKLYDLEKNVYSLKTKDRIQYLIENTRLKKIILPNPESIEAVTIFLDINRFSSESASPCFNRTALQTDIDVYSHKVEKVALMTMHAAKGLEFPVVFIAGCEKNYIPLNKNKNSHPDLDEERRLFYVAMTRAKERLYLTTAGKRKIYGKTMKREISPFVKDIEAGLTEHQELSFKPKQKKQVQLKLF